MPKFPAHKANTGVIFRREPSKSLCMMLWDRRNDTFNLGQWLRGSIYERRCDLLPEGKHFIYFAMNGKSSDPMTGSWTTNRLLGVYCKFLVDFHQVCENLATAGNTSMDLTERNLWLETRKQSLWGSDHQAVIATLNRLVPEIGHEHESHPIGIALSYIEKRKNQFDYQNVIRRKLPIGSGEVGSAHRHILQKRLKISGAWWRLERAEEIAQLRAMKANQCWDDFRQRKLALPPLSVTPYCRSA